MQATLAGLHRTNILPFGARETIGDGETGSKGAGGQGSRGDGETGRRGDGETGSPLVQRSPGPLVPKSPLVSWSPSSPASREQWVDYTIVHSTPGRVRLRVPRIAKDADYALVLETLLGLVPQVTSVRLNVAAMSVTVNYRDEVDPSPSRRNPLGGDPGGGGGGDFQISDLAAIIQKAALPRGDGEQGSRGDGETGRRGDGETGRLGDCPWSPRPLVPPSPGPKRSPRPPVPPSALAAVLAGLSWLGLPIPGLMVGGAIAAASAPVAKKPYRASGKNIVSILIAWI
ncbi:hypothetical protein [[Phormidium] sp. ETS-05]|uniref:hypothetical protein n=1 Tax=[Phormidium] sp. ETS-05 TaxID=222819 RepID=UPI0018EF0B7A|nr:hypothetical protein [[Phormidium] sp. ETS-05]